MSLFANLKKGDHVHLMGICGTAMASLAGLLKSQGFKVTGSDQNVYPPMSTQLERLGIPIMEGYKKENLNPRPDLVIVGNVISKHFEEAEALLASEIPYSSLPKAIGEFVIADRNSIVISGTHGKTTSTAMMATVGLEAAPGMGFMVGGIPENFDMSFSFPENNWFVIEGDEYDTAFFDKVPKFIHYKPKYVILTSIEFDHADIYANLDQIMAAFRRLIELIPADGILMYNAEDQNIKKLISFAKCRTLSYGANIGDYQIKNREMISGRNHFAVHLNGKSIGDIAIKSPGEYNAMNALAVFALGVEVGFSKNKVLQGLANFKGVKRRQQLLGQPGGIKIIEDFAHHPTAVDKTIQAIREQYLADTSGRLFVLFEPRSATSRRKVFQKQYAEAFGGADFVLISEPYDQKKIVEADRFSVADLIKDLNSKALSASAFSEVDDMVTFIKNKAKSDDVVLVMSNGSFGGIYKKLLGVLAASIGG